MNLSKPTFIFGVLVVLLSGGLFFFAFPLPEQDSPPKKDLLLIPAPHSPTVSRRSPTPSSPTEEVTTDKKELARARQLLASTNEHQRIEALKLLGAYPSPVNEAMLVGYLRSQENPKIRSTAALALSTLGKPSASTIETLLGALEDSSEDVRFSALSTLEDYLIFAKQDSASRLRIREGLRAKLQSNRLQADIQKDIDDIVHDR